MKKTGIQQIEEFLAAARAEGKTYGQKAAETYGQAPEPVEPEAISRRGAARARPIEVYTEDGTVVCKYSSIAEASRALNVTENTISRCCTGKKKNNFCSILNLGFRYTEETK